MLLARSAQPHVLLVFLLKPHASSTSHHVMPRMCLVWQPLVTFDAIWACAKVQLDRTPGLMWVVVRATCSGRDEYAMALWLCRLLGLAMVVMERVLEADQTYKVASHLC